MASGYVDVPHVTYDEWRNNTIGNEYDLDGYYGCQCWDYASLFWRNIGFPAGYPLTGPNQSAYECWTVSRVQNQSYGGTTYFDLITDVNNIKRGDVIVMAGNLSNPPGHITFADEDYDGSGRIWCVGQNQGGPPSPGGGTAVTRNNLGLDLFLGAFRYKEWGGGPTPPTPTVKKNKFPWVLYARKLRVN